MTGIYKSERGAKLILQRYDEALDHWPVPSSRHRIPTQAGETFVVSSGPTDASPVVLLHGSGANANTWAVDIATWSTDHRVHAVDLLGEPGHSAGTRLPLDSGDTATWLDEVLGHLGVDSTALVGMSLGGWTALDYAIRRSARVSRLVVMCPGGIGKQTWGWIPKAMILRAFGARGTRRTVRLVTGLGGAETDHILGDVSSTFTHFRPRTEKLPIFSDSVLQGISIPMQVILGADDVMMDSTESADRVARCIPHASVNVLPGVGHAILGQTDPIHEFLRTA